MKAKRKRHSAAFKAKVGFEALVGLKTVSQLAREYAVHPTQVTQWRATIRDHMPELRKRRCQISIIDKYGLSYRSSSPISWSMNSRARVSATVKNERTKLR